MIRKEYRIANSTLSIALSEARLNRRKFVPMVSNRESHLSWKRRIQANNKHTVGTEVW
jgi:hypothetical protein